MTVSTDDSSVAQRFRANGERASLRSLVMGGFSPIRWGGAFGATVAASGVGNENLGPVLLAWATFLLVRLILVRHGRYFAAMFIGLTLYACSAWVLAGFFNETFPPFPPYGVIATGTVAALQMVFVSYAVLETVVGSRRFDSNVRQAVKFFRNALSRRDRMIGDYVANPVLVAVGIHDVLELMSLGIVTVLGSERRAFASELLLASSHNVQLLVVVCSVHSLVRAVMGRRPLFWSLASLALCWMPFVLVGSRKEFLLFALSVFLIVDIGRRARLLAGGVLFPSFLALPALKSGDWFSSMHEFALPQYVQFSVQMNLVPVSVFADFVARGQLLLPDFLRTREVRDPGQVFADLQITGVGVGSSPFGEALQGSDVPLAFFTGSFAILILAMLVLSRTLPEMIIFGFPLLLFYGRSDFWILVFFLAYSSILMRLLRVSVEGDLAADLEAVVQGRQADTLRNW